MKNNSSNLKITASNKRTPDLALYLEKEKILYAIEGKSKSELDHDGTLNPYYGDYLFDARVYANKELITKKSETIEAKIFIHIAQACYYANNYLTSENWKLKNGNNDFKTDGKVLPVLALPKNYQTVLDSLVKKYLLEYEKIDKFCTTKDFDCFLIKKYTNMKMNNFNEDIITF